MVFTFTTPSSSRDYDSHRSAKRQRTEMMDLDEAESSANFAVPGEPIANARDWMRGHGTYLDSANNAVLAGVAGKVERVNKLVSVRAVRGRYKPEVGDLVVGRIVEVQARRWKVDVGARLDAVLMLSSINLPGGVQRRKLESDELQMRTFFAEGDLLVAEVQAFFQDGSISLHTRSLRYGKLRNGQLVKSSPSLIPRLKSHFLSLTAGIELIMGLNGFIWVSSSSSSVSSSTLSGENDALDVAATENLYSSKNDILPIEKQEAIARVVACIDILASSGTQITEQRLAVLRENSLSCDSATGDDHFSSESITYTVRDLAKGAPGRSALLNLVVLSEI